MARKLPSVVPPVSTRPETDYEFGQREVENIDRSTWHGEHPMKVGPRGIVHVEEVSQHIPTVSYKTVSKP